MTRERSERGKIEKNSVLGIKNHRSAAVRGGARRVRPPLDPLVLSTVEEQPTRSRAFCYGIYTLKKNIG